MLPERFALVLLGLARVLNFVRLVIPIILHYKVKQIMGKILGYKVPDEEWERMHKCYAPQALVIAERLQGFYIKIGQHVATTVSSSIPLPYVDSFKPLLEHCPAQPFSVVRSIVEKELGPLEDTFQSFVEFPMSAASTGQVHSARLINGHEVVVKVQHPNAEWSFGVDLCLFVATAEALYPIGVGVLRQVKKNLVSEFDYQKEAAQQREASNHLEGFDNIVVPEPVDEFHKVSPSPKGLCTKRVLVMDRLFGMSLADWGRVHLESQARSQGKTVRELQAQYMVQSTVDLEKMRPSALGMGAYFVVNRGADIACNTALFLYNWGLGYMLRRGVKYVTTPLPPNIHVITKDLMEAQGHMLLRSGYVNCDPHAGNVMLLTDGRLGLIDWGQVVHLTHEQRCILAGLYISVADQDDVMSADCMRALGGRTLHDWDWTLAMWGKFATWSVQECEANNVDLLSKVVDKVDTTVREAESVYIMAFKNQLYTRQVVAMLGFFNVNSAVALRDLAVETLHEAGWPVPHTKPTTIPVPQAVQELLDVLNDKKALGSPESNLEKQDEYMCDFSGWELVLPLTLPPMASYIVLCTLKFLQVPPMTRVIVLLLLCALLAGGMVKFLCARLRKRATIRTRELASMTPSFHPDNRELALASM